MQKNRDYANLWRLSAIGETLLLEADAFVKPTLKRGRQGHPFAEIQSSVQS